MPSGWRSTPSDVGRQPCVRNWSLLWALLASGPASYAQASDVQLWVAPTGGYSSYAMDAINQDIREMRPIYRPEFQPEEISNGPSAGIALGVDFASRWSLAFDYQHLWATSEGGFEHELPANLFGGRVGYRLESTSRYSFGLGFGLGAVMLADAHVGNDRSQFEWSGSGLDLEGSLDLRIRLRNRLHVLVQPGYRSAKIVGLESGGVEFPYPDGRDREVDYTGAFLNLGILVFIHP